MRRPFARFISRVAMSLGMATFFSSGEISAQETVTVSARMGSRPVMTGSDSGKFVLALKVSGLPQDGLRGFKPNQVVLADEYGRVYNAIGFGNSTTPSLVAQYRAASSRSITDRQYFYLVSPTTLAFELRIPGMKPVRFGASLVRPFAR